MAGLKAKLLSLALILFVTGTCCAQAPNPRDESKLTGAYSRFSTNVVLAKIFDGYHPATSSISSILTSEGQPTKVAILAANPWRFGRDEYLVVLTRFGDMPCGNCAAYTPLAVLRTEGTRLSLVARQDLPIHASFSEDEQVSETLGSLSYTGHQSLS